MTCTRCPLHLTRRNQVKGKGVYPADILFIGESPDKTDDLKGVPFSGPTGKFLEVAMTQALKLSKVDDSPTYYMTHLCQCRVCDGKTKSNRAPTPREAESCYYNLCEVVKLVQPIIIVTLGETAKTYVRNFPVKIMHLISPEYLLYKGGVESDLYRLFCRELSNIYRGLANGKA
jgi:uracil-DNA glycosylase family 4